MEKIEAKRAKFAEKKRVLKKQLVNNPVGEIMTLERETILALEIEELIHKLKSGQLDPVAVLEAYQARALEATEATNCVVDFMLEARNQALELRRLPLEYRGPLHGVPVSVKECYFVKGCDATAGLAKFINSPAQEDGPMIKVINCCTKLKLEQTNYSEFNSSGDEKTWCHSVLFNQRATNNELVRLLQSSLWHDNPSSESRKDPRGFIWRRSLPYRHGRLNIRPWIRCWRQSQNPSAFLWHCSPQTNDGPII